MITRITVSGSNYIRVTVGNGGLSQSAVQGLIDTAIASLSIPDIRAEGSVVSTGSEQIIAFSTPFLDAQYALQILDYQGLGFELIEKTASGFTCRFTEAGLFEYIAIKNT